MKFTCTQENLFEGLTSTSPVAGRNTQLPILQHILFQVRAGALHLTSTDLEIGIHTTVGGKVHSEGGCTLEARRIFEYVQQLPSTHPLVIEKKDTTVFVTTEGFHAQFPTGNPDDFPLLPQTKSPHVIQLDGQQLCQGVGRVLFSAARDDTRPEIHSVYIQRKDSEVRVAATDSFRLSEEVLPIQEEGDTFSFLLPLSSAAELVRLFSSRAALHLAPAENHITFSSEGLEVFSRLVEGSYPDYQQIIPTSWRTKMVMEREELLRALKTLSVFLPRESRRVQIHIQPQKKTAILRVGGSESGEGNVELLFKGEGKDLTALFNIQYLIEGVQHLPSDTCEIRFGGPQDPAVLLPHDGRRYLYVVMPIQA